MKEVPQSRAVLFKRALVFQVKLVVDATRDLILSPAGMVCALLDLIKDSDPEQSYFNKLMRFGRQTDHWLNLFGSSNTKPQLSQNAQAEKEHVGQNTAKPYTSFSSTLQHSESFDDALNSLLNNHVSPKIKAVSLLNPKPEQRPKQTTGQDPATQFKSAVSEDERTED